MPRDWSERIDLFGDYMPTVLPTESGAEAQVRVNGTFVYTKNAKGEKFVDGVPVDVVPVIARYIEYRAAPGSEGKKCIVTIDK